METAQIITISGAIITFLGGLVISGLRGTLSRLEENDKAIFERLGKLETGHSALQSAHDTVMSQGGHKK